MSKIEVNTVAPQCGTTLTLGESGDTVTLGTGASQSGFGRTGTVNWNTTVKTGDFTAVNGEGYFVNTTSGEVDVALPAGTAGAIVAVKDYAKTFDTDNCILVPNGSDKIGGYAGSSTLTTEGIAVTLVFIDSTKGWLVTDSGLQEEAPIPEYIVATGGTITTVCTNYKVHTFTGPGTFTVTCAGNAQGSTNVSYMVVAGGGGTDRTNPGSVGGGGAGGFRESKAASDSYTASPLNATSGPTYNLPVSATGYPITVGGGGTGGPVPGPVCGATAGSNSVFTGSTTITSAGGGKGGQAPLNGGSGGGGLNGTSGSPPQPWNGGTGNTPPTSPAQGTNGGNGLSTVPSPPVITYRGGGGGGATAAGTTATAPTAGAGGAGATTSINGTPTAFAGGGGGGSGKEPGGTDVPAGAAGTGGGGAGGARGIATAGTTNTGGGGGGSGYHPGIYAGVNGGSGIVIIRYKFQ